jgi:hypothetical protein
MGLALLDSSTGTVMWEKKNFFAPSYFTALVMSYAHGAESTTQWLQSAFSADGNYLLIGPGDSKLAFDLRTRTPLKIGGDLKNKVTGRYAFVGNGAVAGINNGNFKDSGIFSFPEGKQTMKVNLPLDNIGSVSGSEGQYVLLGLKEGQTGVADLASGKILLMSKVDAVDSWNGFVAAENLDGSVMLAKVLEGKMLDRQRIVLPVSPLGSLRTIALSPDGRHLALSTQAHGGVWSLVTGQQEFLTLGFSNAAWVADGSMYVEFAKFGEKERHVSHLTMTPRGITDLTYKVDDNVHMNYQQLMEWKQVNKGGWEFTVHHLTDAAVAWTKTFPDASPRYTRSFGGNELLFTTPLKVGSVKTKLKANVALAAQAAEVKDRDRGRLVEVVDSATGKTIAEMVLELPVNYDGTDGLNRAGDLLYMTESDNRTAVLSLSNGKQLRQIFGHVIAVDPASQRVCTVNRRDEAVVYDVGGKELAHFRNGSALRFATFQNKGTQLILLSADQTVRTVDVAKGDAGTAIAER